MPHTFNTITFGTEIYPLLKPITVEFIRNGDSFCCVDRIFPFCGEDNTKEDALRGWVYEFRQCFSDVYYQQHWERTERDEELYILFIEFVDVQEHRKQTPMYYTRTGKIIENETIPKHKREIEWIDETRDIINCEDCSLELLQYSVGDYFIAVVLCDYETDNLLKICDVLPNAYRDLTNAEIQEFWDSHPATKDLPDST
ncbi:MAG: hypothetical protein LBC74_08455, partial [Planctomycetaceae bacterium]|nr:hypothetical protein [Planctomycetaceae bacterium]